MWTCPICKAKQDDFDAKDHVHFLFQYLPPNDNDDAGYFGAHPFVEKANRFADVLSSLMYFEGGSRSEALDSLAEVTRLLHDFPHNLREFLLKCLERQYESMSDDEETLSFSDLWNDVEEHIDGILGESTVAVLGSPLQTPENPDDMLAPPTSVYWTLQPKQWGAECVKRLEDEIAQLQRLELRRSRYIVRRSA